jgi:hypothetical protein
MTGCVLFLWGWWGGKKGACACADSVVHTQQGMKWMRSWCTHSKA